MKTLVPPLKCQGKKTKLVPWIVDVVDQLPRDSRWIEPFTGSGVVGFNVKPCNAIFADSNPHIISLYKDIQSGIITDKIMKNYLITEGGLLSVAGDNGWDHYRLVRDRFNGLHDTKDFLFLSRSGFNGLVRFSKKGNWNVPFCKKPNRFTKAYITKICNQIAASASVMKDAWCFKCQDFRETIKSATINDVIYCDPPYLGRYADYFNGWNEEDESSLSTLLQQTKARFILSSWHHNCFRVNVNIEKYWSMFNIITKNHFYNVGVKHTPVVEALICNFSI